MHFLKSVKNFLFLGVILLSLSACKTSPAGSESTINTGAEINVSANLNNETTSDDDAPEPLSGTFYLEKFHLFPRDSNGWDEGGWSVVIPSLDSRLVYVSSSLGNDDTAGFVKSSDVDDVNNPGSIKPYKTIEAALGQTRDGYPDWVILRRGDVWEVPNVLSIRAGRSVFERSVVTSYGSSKYRPLIKTQANKGLSLWGSVDFVAIIGISLYADFRDPESTEFAGWGQVGNPSGISMYQPEGIVKRSILIEDNEINFFGTGIVMTGAGSLQDIVIRRNIIRNSYSETSHSQGIYAANASILLEENIFDHNGWYKKQEDGGSYNAEGQATMFNHNTYFSNSFNSKFIRNIFLRSSSIQNKWTANSDTGSSIDSIKSHDLWMEDNVYVGGEIGISAGGNTDYDTGPRWQNITIINNVLMAIGRDQPTNRTLGWNIDADDWDGGLICGNYILNTDNLAVSGLIGIKLGGHSRDVRIAENTLHGLIRSTPSSIAGAITVNSSPKENITISKNNIQLANSKMRVLVTDPLDSIKFEGNNYFSGLISNEWFGSLGVNYDIDGWRTASGDINSTVGQASFLEPKRTFETYLSSIGLAQSIDDFMEQAVNQSKDNWNQDITAQAVITYIREAYGNLICQ